MISWDGPSSLDRMDAHRGSRTWVANLWVDEHAKLLKLDADVRYTTNAEGDRLRMTKPFVEYDDQRHILLGLVDDVPYFSVDAKVEGPVHSLRENGHRLSALELDLAAEASALAQWHRTGKFCSNCGHLTEVRNGGMQRVCPHCQAQHFPRTDPAVIVAVIDDQDRILLGRQRVWPERRVSVLAGFVEAGESLEQTVHREIAEEVDIQLSQVSYVASQPWPFPRSIMLGFAARACTTAICVDGAEIESADWYDRDRVRADVASEKLFLPMESSIARRLIESWLAGELPL
ncbi:MAG: NAD(+) diphosphatase [Propionibacteriaceae bacterium]